ncbi:MAG: methylated-DNA--[protein]-cysteine S-methyltransferase [Proteobacteria bacterium]|nr:methylated-DNA--[protein]-cysteine S-methyltransferase [Pseudomonadota bacterium]
MYDTIINTPIGLIGIQCCDSKLSAIHFLDQHIIPLPSAKPPEKVREIAKKIEGFFSKATSLTDLPHVAKGTAFQKKVWRALCKIPLGQTRTYGELAKRLSTSPRAVGMACRTNPLALVIPCHRVVGVTTLGGFCGKRSKVIIKEWLLAHERGSC